MRWLSLWSAALGGLFTFSTSSHVQDSRAHRVHLRKGDPSPPGDVVVTGVPAPVVPLRAGDTVGITMEKLALPNRVVAKAESRATQ